MEKIIKKMEEILNSPETKELSEKITELEKEKQELEKEQCYSIQELLLPLKGNCYKKEVEGKFQYFCIIDVPNVVFHKFRNSFNPYQIPAFFIDVIPNQYYNETSFEKINNIVTRFFCDTIFYKEIPEIHKSASAVRISNSEFLKVLDEAQESLKNTILNL